MIEDLEVVVFTRAVPEHRLEAGDVGAVVMIHRDGAAFEVEFFSVAGDTMAIVTLPADAVRPVSPREIVHARAVA